MARFILACLFLSLLSSPASAAIRNAAFDHPMAACQVVVGALQDNSAYKAELASQLREKRALAVDVYVEETAGGFEFAREYREKRKQMMLELHEAAKSKVMDFNVAELKELEDKLVEVRKKYRISSEVLVRHQLRLEELLQSKDVQRAIVYLAGKKGDLGSLTKGAVVPPSVVASIEKDLTRVSLEWIYVATDRELEANAQEYLQLRLEIDSRVRGTMPELLAEVDSLALKLGELRPKKPSQVEVLIASEGPELEFSLLNYISTLKDRNDSQLKLMEPSVVVHRVVHHILQNNKELTALLLAEIQINYPKEFELMVDSVAASDLAQTQQQVEALEKKMQKLETDLANAQEAQKKELENGLFKTKSELSVKQIDLGSRISKVAARVGTTRAIIALVVIADIAAHIIF